MINAMKMKLFPYSTNQIAIPTNDDRPYNVIFMSENSDFLTVYPKLGIRRQFVKEVTVIPSKIPRLIVNTQMLMPYRKNLGLIPIMIPDKGNIFLDTVPFFNLIESQYGKGKYRQNTIMTKVISYLNTAKSFGDHKSILMYHINLSETLSDQLINSRSIVLAMIAKIGDGTFPFDNVLISKEENGIVKFSSIFNKSEKPLETGRIFSILKSLIQSKEKELEEPTITSVPEKQSEDKEKQSILNAIDNYQKKRLITS